MRLSGSSREWVTSAAALALAVGLCAASEARAQTVTSGAISGIAVSTDGQPLAAVSVTLTHGATGWARNVVTDPSGAFRSPALPPGRYDVLAELLGFRPLVVLGVTVSPAAAVTLTLRLTPAEPPVTQVDTVVFVEGAPVASLARGTWEPGQELVDLADPQGRVQALATVAAASAGGGAEGGGLALEGLPDRLASVGVDGIIRTAATHSGASRPDLAALGLPFSSLDHAEVAAGTDVEWPSYGGELLSAFTARAPREPQLRGFADGNGSSYRGALLVGGPIVRDTAWAMLGVDARRLESRFGAPWPGGAAANAIAAVARDSFKTSLAGYQSPVTERSDLVTVFGRFDWDIAAGHTAALRAAVTNLTAHDLDLGTGRFVGLGTALDGRDVSVSGSLRSRLVGSLHSEISLAVDRSMRDYGAPSLPGTVLPADGLVAGSDGALPGRFERDATRFSATLFYQLGAHVLKAGATTSWTSHDISYDPWRAGTYVFGSAADFTRRRGAFVQSVGGVPDAAFTIGSVAAFAQDSWSPVGGLSVLFGARLEREQWPTGEVAANPHWVSLTGLSNAVVPRFKTRASPRLSFTWSAGPNREWLLKGDAGLFSESVDPSLLAEALSHDGTARFRRGLGALGAWPAVPDSTVAAVTGPVLTILNPSFEPPRTGRTSLSIAREIGSGASLQVVGQYRHTDFLPRRSDLNLIAAPQSTDQFGRPIYGALQQYGSMLAVTPGSNRRFGDFDRVWALDPSGYSDYWGVTVSLERVRETGLSLWASYTYSRTTDNTPGLLGTVPEAQLSPFPATAGAPDWRAGTSDLDVPHRLSVGAEVSFGVVRLAGLVRYQSGMPFTPGFRDGVDANGDGSWSNDPAYVSDTVTGTAALLGSWACLRRQIGSFAARNSCRGPAITSADARLVLRLFTLSGAPAELVVDGLDLVTLNDGIVDRALYLVDPARTLSTNPVSGVVTVPLVANAGFGKLLVRRSPGSTVRAGVRFNF